MLQRIIQSFRKKEMALPEFIVINVNEECFFKCQMCHKWKPDINIKPGSKKLTKEEIDDFVDQLARLMPKGTILNFAGGEPYLRKDMIGIIRHASKKGFYTQVATNGWLIDTEDKAKEIVESGLGGIIFSVDGASAKTHDSIRRKEGSFERVLFAIKALGKYRDALQGDREFNDRLCISIQTVLCDLNYREAPEMIEWVDSSDIRSVHFNAVSEPNNTKHDPSWYKNEFSFLWPKDKEDFVKVIEIIEKKKRDGSKIAESLAQIRAYKNYFTRPEDFVKHGPCNFDRSLTLSSTGDIFMCFNYGSIGNIRHTKLRDAWSSENARIIRKDIRACRQNCHFLINCYYEEEE